MFDPGRYFQNRDHVIQRGEPHPQRAHMHQRIVFRMSICIAQGHIDNHLVKQPHEPSLPISFGIAKQGPGNARKGGIAFLGRGLRSVFVRWRYPQRLGTIFLMDSRNSTSLVYRTVKTLNTKDLRAIRQLKHRNTRCVSHARCHAWPKLPLEPEQYTKSERHCGPDGECRYAYCANRLLKSNYQS